MKIHAMVSSCKLRIQWTVNLVYECENKEQLIKYYHVSLGYTQNTHSMPRPRQANCKSALAYLSPEAINRFISVEDTTEMDHMRATPAGKQSTTKTRSKLRVPIDFEKEKKATEADTIAVPDQEPNNQKTKHIFMKVTLADFFIASGQTGAYPRTSSRGNKCICVF